MKFWCLLLSVSLLLTACSSGTTPVTIVENPLVVQAQGSLWLALKDGDDDWQFVTNTLSDPLVTQTLSSYHDVTSHVTNGQVVLSLADTQGRYALASVCANNIIKVYASTLTETDTPELNCDTTSNATESSPGYDLEITVNNLSTNATINLPETSNTVTPANPTFRTTRPQTLYDLIVAQQNATNVPTSLILRHNLYNQSSLNINFANAVATIPASLSISGNTSAETVFTEVRLRTRNNTTLTLGTGNTSVTYATLPDSLLQPGDTYETRVSASQFNTTSNTGSLRQHTMQTTQAPATPLTLPPNLTNITTTHTPLSISWDPHPNAQSYQLEFEQAHEATTLRYDIGLSSGYVMAFGTVFTMPDFSDVSNWDDAWSFRNDLRIDWQLSALDKYLARAPSANATTVTAFGVLTADDAFLQ